MTLLPPGSVGPTTPAPEPTTTPAAPVVASALAAIPSGFTTSEGKIVARLLTFLGLLVVVFDVIAFTHAVADLPTWALPTVDGGYAAAAAYIAANYTNARTQVKVAAVSAAGSSPPA